MTRDDLDAMPLHSIRSIEEKGLVVIRVPNGWLYMFEDGSRMTNPVFVPEELWKRDNWFGGPR